MNPTPQTMTKTLKGRGIATTRRVSILTFCPWMTKSCRFAGIMTFGRITAPIPSRISTTPPRTNSVGFTIGILSDKHFAALHITENSVTVYLAKG